MGVGCFCIRITYIQKSAANTLGAVSGSQNAQPPLSGPTGHVGGTIAQSLIRSAGDLTLGRDAHMHIQGPAQLDKAKIRTTALQC